MATSRSAAAQTEGPYASARRPFAPDEPTTTFFVVGVQTVSCSNSVDRHVRKGASFDDPDPWVRIAGPIGRSAEVHRFGTKEAAEAWAKGRKKAKGTHCRVMPCRGVVMVTPGEQK